MSTLTKEWLKHTIAELEEERDATPGAVNEDAANALAAMKIALTMLEAEPMAYIRSAHNPDGFCFADGIHPTHRHQRLPLSTLQDGCYWKVTPLYTAPPAPVVPDAISTRQAIAQMENHEPCDSINVAYKFGWNACRAALLKGTYGNSPAVSDGWVLVPKEPTPDMFIVRCSQ
ncbi:hypothetical protein [Enterobacter hormaechei]|uniref:hypothetical protein n=1 Tax=Enterobacter hormaechei TaxID=158836 RepID=UPI003A9813D4